MSFYRQYVVADNDACRQALVNKGVLLLRAARETATAISFLGVEAPDVSVIIVARDAPELLAVTLYGLQQHQAFCRAKLEVIIVDNASQAPARDLVACVGNAVVIRSDTNLGFGKACNLAAAQSRSPSLLFLNPDIEMMPGCLDFLLATSRFSEENAIVGGRLIFPGGRLQEAGALFLDDDQLTHPYLRGSDFPFAAEANYLRKSAYVSGALMLVRREAFQALRGFDDRFSPAYFEDTDLCMRCWKAGMNVVYDPRAVAMHFEHATSKDHEDVKALMDRNRQLFRDLHAGWIFSTPATTSRRPLDVRAFDMPRLKILMIDDRVPYEYLGSGYPRANKIIRIMVALGYFISFFPLHQSEDFPEDGYIGLPREVEILGGSFEATLTEILSSRSKYYDAIWISRPHNINIVAGIFRDAGCNMRDFVKSAIIFDAEALYATRNHVARYVSGAIATSRELEASIASETLLYQMADQVVCVSEYERQIISDFGVRNTVVLGHATQPLASIPGFDERTEIMFLGAMTAVDSPNVDSMLWFAREVMPILMRRMGLDLHIKVVGPVTDDVKTLFESLPCDLLGHVDDLDLPLATARLLVAPTRYSAGVPIKFFEALARGVPLVLTPLLAQQIGWPDGAGFVTADWTDPEGFAEAVRKLFLSPELWETVQRRGLKRLKEECCEVRFREKLRNICEVNLFPYL